MVARTTKKRSKRSGVAKTKRVRAKPLATLPAVERRTSAPMPASAPAQGNPAFAIFELITRVTQAYAEIPLRLAQCRTPVDVLSVQAAFTRRILGA